MKETKKTIQEQVTYLIDQGIIVHDRGIAENYLSDHLNFYRLCSYLKLLSYGNTGKYIKDISFNHLVELSKLDLAFRRVILPMTIDIEFASKLELNKDCSNNPSDDGYSFATSYILKEPLLNKKFQEKISSNTDEYAKEILVNHYPNLAVWHLMEMMTFGEFIFFWKNYYTAFPNPRINITWRNNLFFVTKKLRNACAHNNFMLPSLKKTPNQINKQFMSRIAFLFSSNGQQISEAEKKTIKSSMLLSDFLMMLMLFDEIVISKSLRNKASSELHELFDNRMPANKSLFLSSKDLVANYQVAKKIVDMIFPL